MLTLLLTHLHDSIQVGELEKYRLLQNLLVILKILV